MSDKILHFVHLRDCYVLGKTEHLWHLVDDIGNPPKTMCGLPCPEKTAYVNGVYRESLCKHCYHKMDQLSIISWEEEIA